MDDLNVTANFNDLQDLKRILTELGPAATAMVARLTRENKRLTQALQADAKVQQQAIEMTIGVIAQKSMTEWGNAQRRRIALMQESERMAQREIATTLRQRDAEAQLAASRASSYQSNIGGNLGLSSNGTNAAASAAAMSAEMDRLRSKYDSIYASSKRYEASLEELNMAHRMGVFNAKQHELAVENLNREFAQVSTRSAMAAGKMNQWGVVTQQTGYQVGDFLVQIQSGTNWMVAFGQQATQLVGVLPLVATSLGLTTAAAIGLSTVLGIGIPLITALGALWMRSGSEGEEALTKVEDSLKRLSSETDSLAAKWSELRFGTEFGQMMEDLSIRVAQINEDLKVLDAERAIAGGRQIGILENQIALKEEELQLSIKDLAQLSDANNKRAEAQAKLDKEISSAKERNLQYTTYYNSLVASEKAITAAAKRAEELAKAIEEGKIRAQKLSDILTSLSGTSISVAVNFQAAFSGFTGKAAEWASGVAGTMSAIAGGSEPIFNSPRPRGAPAMLGEVEGSGSSGGSGGGGNARLESLITELQTEQETLAIWYEESQSALQSASDAELAIVGGKNEAKIKLEEEYQSRLRGLLSAETNTRLGETGDMFGALADLAGVGGKKMLKVQATLSAASTTIAAYENAVTAAAKATTIPGKIAAYATFLAQGLGAVAKIKSIGGAGGGGGGGGVGTSTVAPTEREPNPQTVYVDSITPDSLYSGQTLINLFEAFYNENDKRGKVFVVAR